LEEERIFSEGQKWGGGVKFIVQDVKECWVKRRGSGEKKRSGKEVNGTSGVLREKKIIRVRPWETKNRIVRREG